MPPGRRSGKAWTATWPASQIGRATFRIPVPALRPLLLLVLLLALPLPLPARAEVVQPAPPALLDAAAAPGLGPNGRAALGQALLANLPRVFVIGPGQAYAWRSGPAAVEELERQALEACRGISQGGAPCRTWLRNLEIAWPGREWAAAPPPEDLAFGDGRRVTLPDPRFLWWGPETARGVLVWAHGRVPGGADSRGIQPQAWVRHFNQAGFDIWRFDRDPATDFTAAAGTWLRADLAELRRRGYRRVIAAGQSRGAWNALQALDTPGLAEATIAIAPAALGNPDEVGQAAQIAGLRALVGAAAGTGRVAVANFRSDPFDGRPEERAEVLRGLLGRSAAFLLIDRPEGIEGHLGGTTRAFSQRFGPCLLVFATAKAPPATC
jgi:hypothetical protein